MSIGRPISAARGAALEVGALAFRRDGSRHKVIAPWPKATLIDDGAIDASFGHVEHCGDTVKITVANGWALYRRMERQPNNRGYLYHLVASELTAPTARRRP